MFGIDDKWVSLVYALCIASTLLCVIYSAINWNRGDDTMNEEDVQWQKKDKEVEDHLTE